MSPRLRDRPCFSDQGDDGDYVRSRAITAVARVVSGEQRGGLWRDDRAEYTGLPILLKDGSAADFLGWYGEWIERLAIMIAKTLHRCTANVPSLSGFQVWYLAVAGRGTVVTRRKGRASTS